MIILRYGDAKKLESSKRWKCKCFKCGCKVLLNKEDVQKYANEYDSDGRRYTSFYWECPYCETELYSKEYDMLFFRITESIKDKLEEFADGREELCIAITVTLVAALLFLIVGGFIDSYFKHYDKTYNYRIQYEDNNGHHHTEWTNEIEEKYGCVIYIDEDGYKKKQDLDTTVIIDLKEEDK